MDKCEKRVIHGLTNLLPSLHDLFIEFMNDILEEVSLIIFISVHQLNKFLEIAGFQKVLKHISFNLIVENQFLVNLVYANKVSD